MVLTPDEVVRILGFLEGEHRLFAQLRKERACGSVRVCNCGQGSGFRSRHDHRAGGQGLQGSGLDVTRELASSLREQLVACTGMVAEGPGRTQRRCAPDALSGSIGMGIPGRVLGFCAAHAFDRSTAGVVRRHHMYDQTFSAPSNVP